MATHDEFLDSLGYVRALARTVRPPDLYDDLVSEGHLALWRAWLRFRGRPRGVATFLTFAHKAVLGAMLKYRQRQERHPTVALTGDPPCGRQEEARPCLADLGPLLGILPDRERLAVELVHLDGRTLSDAAALIGVRSKQHVRGLLTQARNYLRFAVEHPGFAGSVRSAYRARGQRNRKPRRAKEGLAGIAEEVRP